MPEVVDQRFTRESLTDFHVRSLWQATAEGRRICFGQDHQYSIPYGLALELGIADLEWREAVRTLVEGSYGPGAPPLGHARDFAPAFNAWLISQGRSPYFFSRTKSNEYRVPQTDPRRGDDSVYRITELCQSIYHTGRPVAFNQLGDNGSVGGQTLVGLVMLHRLLAACERNGIPVKVWPFDGLSIVGPSYTGCHVLVEPYPAAARALHIPRSDEADAIAACTIVQDADERGALPALLDLNALTPQEQQIVQFEGWIVGHTPLHRRRV